MRALLVLSATSLFAATRLSAQALQSIGSTSAGTPVMLEPKSVSRANGIVTATVRVRLVPPLKAAEGELRSSRTIAMYDCAKHTVATKESWYYLDDAGTKEGMHKVVKVPGYGPVFKGSLADVAMTYLCAPAAPPAKK
ncbi:MAG: hypothetical protein K2R93_12750 [Gemmatimonadaceae bacterium]|nr:hypothetical protein [Gemmatimonadaceae bacterium]